MAGTTVLPQDPVRAGEGSTGDGAAEFTLETLLADELVQLLMASDGVSVEDIRALAWIAPLVGVRPRSS